MPAIEPSWNELDAHDPISGERETPLNCCTAKRET